MKLGIIGLGKMGSAIVEGILKHRHFEDIYLYDKKMDYLRTIMKDKDVKIVELNELFDNSDVILIAVKPQDFLELAQKIKGDKLFVSIMAGVKIDTLEKSLDSKRIVRVMPNLNAFVQESSSAYSSTSVVNENELKIVEKILSSFGNHKILSEDLLDAATGLSGSGPAYVAYFIESLAKAGESQGLSYEDSYNLSLQTVIGTSKLIKELNINPNDLIKNVSSKGGTTEKGMGILNESNFNKIILDTVDAATKQSKELGKK